MQRFFLPPGDPLQRGTRKPCINFSMEWKMDSAIGFLTFGTLGFVVAFAYISARATEKRLRDTRAQKARSAAGKPAVQG